MSVTRRTNRMGWGLLVALMCAALPATARKTDLSGNKMDNVYDIGDRRVAHRSLISLQREISIGKQYAAQINRSSKLLKDPVVTEYVNRVEQNIAENSDAKEPISVRIIESPEVNAFTLPGGYIYVYTGLLRTVSSEAELAAVLAHETGHVAARHWAAEQTKQTLLQYAMIPLIFTPMSYPVYMGVSEGLNLGIPMSFLKFSREDEQQADFLGLQYLWKAGYDPNAFLSMFAKIMKEQRSDPGSVPSVFLDHPPTEARILRAAEEIKNILPPRKQYLESTSEFQHVQERLDTILGRMKRNAANSNKPTLLKRQPKAGQTSGGKQGSDDDKPPILRRRN